MATARIDILRSPDIRLQLRYDSMSVRLNRRKYTKLTMDLPTTIDHHRYLRDHGLLNSSMRQFFHQDLIRMLQHRQRIWRRLQNTTMVHMLL